MNCPHCQKELAIPDTAERNLETYNPHGSCIVRAECCGRGIRLSAHLTFFASAYTGINTEDDWGRPFKPTPPNKIDSTSNTNSQQEAK